MFGMSMPELILIFAIALIVIGPKKLPDLAKTLGRALGELKQATGEFKKTVMMDEELDEVKNSIRDVKETVKEAIDLKTVNKDDKQDDKNKKTE